jgi:hypothetical protein
MSFHSSDCLIFCFGSFVQTGFAQEQVKEKKNSAFIEGFGAGAYYSLNYSRLLFKKKQYILSARIGISSYHFRDFQDKVNPDFIIPLGLQLIYGQQHQIVAGFGNTFTSLVQASNHNFEPTRKLKSSGYLSLGYRFRKKGSPYFFELAYSPLFERYQHFRHWGALRIGRFF